MTRTFTFLLVFISSCVSAQVYYGAGGAIQNNGQITYFPMSVSGLNPANIDSVYGITGVCINITHPAVQELNVYLMSPSGMQVMLTLGSSMNGPDFVNTCFNMSAGSAVTNGTTPYNGTFRPVGQLGRFNYGQNGNGTWKLVVKDFVLFSNSGTVNSWSVTFGPLAPSPVNFSSSNIPIVMINTNNQPISTNHIIASMGIIDNSPNRNHTWDPANNYNNKIMIHLRGHTSMTFEKKSYSIETRDAGGNTIDVPLLGMPAENDWDLIASYQDKSLLRNAFTYDLYRKMGRYAPRIRNVELFVNNAYMGVYALVEKVKRDSNRVSVSKLTLTDNTWPDVSGGYILKIDRTDAPGWYSLYPGLSSQGNKFYYQYVYPKDSDITTPQRNYIKSFLDSFETAMNGPNFADPNIGYAKYIAVGSFVDFFIMNEVAKNIDGYRLSSYLYKEKCTDGGKIHVGPVWDFDISYHNCNYGNASSPNGWESWVQVNDNPSPTWYNRLMQDSAFRNKLYCRWQELRQDILANGTLFAYLDSSANNMNESQARNFKQWPIMGAYIYPNPQSQNGATYQGEITDIKSWLNTRIGWLDYAIQGNCTILTGEQELTSGNSIKIYPNPVGDYATFEIHLDQDAEVSLSVKDIVGRDVALLLNGHANAGSSEIHFDRGQMPAGVYFYQFQVNRTVKTGKVVIE